MENKQPIPQTDDSSDFLTEDPMAGHMDMGGLFSNSFANIKTLYSSAKGPCILYSATRYGRRFILKGLKEEWRHDPIRNLALAKEFEIGFSLEHPNIRRTIGMEEVEDLGQVIVLEYIDGRSLEEALRRKEISISVGRKICRQIAETLSYIHGKRILHRDIKPANILLTHPDDDTRMIDFNLSDSDSFIILKNPAGSGKYIAPELLTPGATHTPASDIYSLGVLTAEVAEATSDPHLAEIADRCMDTDSRKRPDGLRLLKEYHEGWPSTFGKTLDSKWTTVILTGISTVLAAIIAMHYLL